jgi:voltage-gated potassium channel
MLWIISGIIMYYVEWSINHNFDSIPNALWRAIVTMSTTWYGDMYPVSSLGKFIASFIIFLGPIFLGIISSLTVLTFFDVLKQEESEANDVKTTNTVVCTKCFCSSHDVDANYCKQCGTILPHKLWILKK